jgi:hypothetical protein
MLMCVRRILSILHLSAAAPHESSFIETSKQLLGAFDRLGLDTYHTPSPTVAPEWITGIRALLAACTADRLIPSTIALQASISAWIADEQLRFDDEQYNTLVLLSARLQDRHSPHV